MPRVSIVASVKNEEKYIADLLNSIANLNYPRDKLETIIIDGGSTDRTIEILSQYPFVKLIKSHCNLSEGKNIGIQNATGEIITFLDGDCIADRDWIKNIVRHFQNDKEIVAVGGPYLYANQNEFFAKYRATYFSSFWFPKKTGFIRQAGTLGGGNTAYRREVFEKANLFNPQLGRGASISSGEDVDFNSRLLSLGYKLFYAKDVKIYHKFQTTFREGFRQAFKDGMDSSMYYRKFGRQNGETVKLRNVLLPFSFLALGLFFALSLLSKFFLIAYVIIILSICYYLYKLVRFYLRAQIGASLTLRIAAPIFDILMMLFWSVGALVGLINQKKT